MAKTDPTGATGYPTGDAIPFPDPFGPYPDQPYPSGSAAGPAQALPDSPHAAAEPLDEADPPTDPAMAPVATDDTFDPFAADAFWFPERPWYRKQSATIALWAIGAAVVAMVVAAVLLVVRDSGESGGSDSTATPGTTAPSTTAPTRSQSPEPPPPPPPPPESPPASAEPRNTWVPQYPRQADNDRPNVTTPQTRPPQISVRPTHRPAFPNQPGGG